jgi:hypothetical protein
MAISNSMFVCEIVIEIENETETDRPDESSYLIGNSHGTTILTA